MYMNVNVNSLNPCCNGIYLIIIMEKKNVIESLSLNPCCNGIYLIIYHIRARHYHQPS